MKVLPRRRKAVLINSVLGVAVLAGAGGAYAAVTSHSDTPARAGSKTVEVTKGTVLATVSGSGSLASPSDAGVNFTTGGKLTEVDVKPGDKVSRGQVLGKVDATAAKETLAQDEASLTAARANLTKAQEGQPSSSTASGSGGGSSTRGSANTAPVPAASPTVDPAQLAQAEAQLTQAQNAVDAAQRAVDGTTLTAPVAGTVASVSAKTGDTVTGTGGNGTNGGGGGSGNASNSGSNSASSSSSSALSGFVVLTNPSGMQVTANFSEADALKVKPGQAATVTLNAESDTVLNAKVLSVSSLPVSSGSGSGGGGGNSSSGSAVQYAATLTITSPTTNLRTGLSASIQVVTGEASGALSVPTAAVTGTGANRTVTVVKADGTTERTPVTVGLEGDSSDQILSGLSEGEKVQLASVSATGNGGFPSGAFPGGLGGGGARTRGGGGGGGGFRAGGGGGGRG
ncbi:efflux RND transporter periplasmic adaptor subunit [Streptomyces violascens]|uniref:RND transporter n=1 Tax=Streptomyces violascens TaxID=67381 RepID=A0ABQ3QUH2_9ACTN|nr:biotin/lipoyl-binding protein [Streptomyces violascens]GGU06002.1 RND transporter [Streptomyces violascens]GHI40915.1 RND transporter [Streptomyces violascens]